ncbi:MAG: phosphoribosylformylglycinamidine synthase subunit PurQ [Alphaproteobacteria bacterium]|nr:phosphoribosylformylglycinamidine synthase subunit PurQ [Alphaproteobacteria bacterium]MCL2504961.1 phosphoribosylformylglycinamidine synthase subunit PurQ [Alphaproteobacteria bacterium]
MRSAVIIFPGSNCEKDVAVALKKTTGKTPYMVWHADTLPDVDLIVLPGGFSYGDYLRTGALAARSPIMQEVKCRAAKGVRVWGICNGFQVLCESGLLPGILLRNKSMKFICKRVSLRVENTDSDFTRLCSKGQSLEMIIAHGDGNYFASPDIIKELEDNGRVAFKYNQNPNGSINDIAGILNETKNVLGMMPHPERVMEPLHGGTDGRILFDSVVKVLA